METPAAPGGEQPQAQATPEITAPATNKEPLPPSNAVVVTDDMLSSVDFSKMTGEQMAELESGDPARIAVVLNLPPIEKKAEAVTTTAEPVAPAAAEGKVSADGPDRMSLKSIKDADARVQLVRATQALRDGKFSSLKEALAAEFGFGTPEAPAAADNTQAAKETAPVVPVVPPKVQELQSKIDALQAERAQKKAEYDYEGAEALTEQIGDLKLDLRDAKREAESQQVVQHTFAQQEDTSRNAVLSKYSEHMTDPDSKFNQLLDEEIVLAEHRKDPILTKPDWPEKIADRTFEKHKAVLGVANSVPVEAEAQTEIPPAPVRDGIRMPGSPVGGSAKTTALTAQAAFGEFDTLTPDEQIAVLNLIEARKAKT